VSDWQGVEPERLDRPKSGRRGECSRQVLGESESRAFDAAQVTEQLGSPGGKVLEAQGVAELTTPRRASVRDVAPRVHSALAM